MHDLDPTQSQLFIDDHIIAHQTLLQRVVHQPIRWSRVNPILTPDMPWESPSLAFLIAVYADEDIGGYRAWYMTQQSGHSVFCTAVSADGVDWTRPDLDFCRDFAGGPNNIMFTFPAACDQPTILRDPQDTERPWKIVFYSVGSYYVGHSTDGLRWTVPQNPDQALTASGYGDRGTALLAPGADEPYMVFTRDLEDARAHQLVRCICRLGSHDARTVSSSTMVLRPDLEDGPDVEFYQMSAFRYESVYVGLIKRYFKTEPTFSDIELAVSRDTHTWQRVRPRQAFFAPPPNAREIGAFDMGTVCPAPSPPIRIGDALCFYYYGSASFHGDRFMTHDRCFGIAKLRVDGFASLNASKNRPGQVTTRPFMCPGGKLMLNGLVYGGNLWGYDDLEEADGYLRAEVLDSDGQVIPGFSRHNARPLFKDTVGVGPVSEHAWLDASGLPRDLSSLQDRHIALRFLLRSAELYSFRIETDRDALRSAS
ncbi:MAG: hypothetical protein CMJ49_14205 [Planctomycetaceae bacterium]|nr:hypothetical protein [Planctomycetaceae bacterium]